LSGRRHRRAPSRGAGCHSGEHPGRVRWTRRGRSPLRVWALWCRPVALPHGRRDL